MMTSSSTRPRDIVGWAWTISLVAWVVASRWAYVSDAPLMSKDGPLYIESLRLDRSYSVPMPGNLGYVLLGRAAGMVWPEPTRAFAAVNAALTAVAVVLLFRVAKCFVPVALAGGLSLKWAIVHGGHEAADDPHTARLASRPGPGAKQLPDNAVCEPGRLPSGASDST